MKENSMYRASTVEKMLKEIHIHRIPEFHIGTGTLSRLISISHKYNIKKPLFITGQSSLEKNGHWSVISEMFSSPLRRRVSSEPSCALIDTITDDAMTCGADGIIAVGGGSVLDTGKAVAAMAKEENSVRNYLEGVGTRKPSGQRLPLIAVPTTSGTGSEATSNAVISEIGPDGFKKSLRHENYIPDAVIIDSTLLTSSTPLVYISAGLDAITQLLESYISLASTAFSDLVAFEGLSCAFRSLPLIHMEPENQKFRMEMAYAAFLSGVALANAGLGIVHGFASVIGAKKEIPHGLICAILLAESINEIAEKALHEPEKHTETLDKLSLIADLIEKNQTKNTEGKTGLLIEHLRSWKKEFTLPGLDSFGFCEEDYRVFAEQTGQKNTPVILDNESRYNILESCR